VGSDTEDVNLAGGVLDDGERVEPGEVDGVDVKQVAGHDSVGLGAEEVAPGGPDRRVDGSMPAAWRILQTVEAPIW
jgi:hypothetical protein